MYTISKQFSFAYGHRVWSQSLNTELSIDGCLACRHLHGHEGLVEVELEAEKLERGMVTDFKHLNWLKVFLDDYFDHKFIIDVSDPLFQVITGRMPLQVMGHVGGIGLGYFDLDPEAPLMNEFVESFVVVNFVPTSENITKFLFNHIKKVMAPHGYRVKTVSFKETPKSKAVYSE